MNDLSALILAGGKSSRMGVNIVSKAFVKLNEKPLIDYVIQSIEPQVDRVLLSGSRTSLLGLSYPIIEDLGSRYSGPLAGLYSALESSLFDSTEYVVIVPCDGPFIPNNLVCKLHDAIKENDSDVCFIQYDGILQTTFSIWNTRVKESVKKAFLVNKDGGFKRLATGLNSTFLPWPVTSVNPFFNINSKKDLNLAEAILCL